jgi:hypothetical protein
MKYLRVVGSLAVYNYLDVCQEALCILPIRMVCTVHQAARIILVFFYIRSTCQVQYIIYVTVQQIRISWGIVT